VLPGGFGTLDEAFELLTLIQTGKAEPAPVVLLDIPGGGYWKAWERFVTDEVASRNLISSGDTCLYRIVDRVDDAAKEILGFYRNYHSLRWVGDTLVIRLEARPTEAEAAELSEAFADAIQGPIRVLDRPLPAERRIDRVSYSRLRLLIDALNQLPSAPPPPLVRTASREASRPRAS
jgi:hypothetical protein